LVPTPRQHTLTLKRDDSDHVEVGAPPIWTKDGWLLLYSHIQNYFSDNKVFGIEAALLALEDPTNVVRRTVYPFMAPEEGYEKLRPLPKIIFPSGATRHGDRLTMYYGSTDTTCCRATLSFQGLLDSMSSDGSIKQHVERSEQTPSSTIAEHPWESNYVLNPTAIELEGDVHILYRALGPDNTSVIGYARSHDGVHITQRLTQPIYEPRAKFEKKPAAPTICPDAKTPASSASASDCISPIPPTTASPPRALPRAPSASLISWPTTSITGPSPNSLAPKASTTRTPASSPRR
jgi:predicted GH43/DUF377 family glycosyl hydrolase